MADTFYRPGIDELYKQPDVEITKWSGPYFNEEQQRGAFQSLLQVGGSPNSYHHHQRQHYPSDVGGTKRTSSDSMSMSSSSSSDFDPNKLLNPVQRPNVRHLKESDGPEGQTFIGKDSCSFISIIREGCV